MHCAAGGKPPAAGRQAAKHRLGDSSRHAFARPGDQEWVGILNHIFVEARMRYRSIAMINSTLRTPGEHRRATQFPPSVSLSDRRARTIHASMPGSIAERTSSTRSAAIACSFVQAFAIRRRCVPISPSRLEHRRCQLMFARAPNDARPIPGCRLGLRHAWYLLLTKRSDSRTPANVKRRCKRLKFSSSYRRATPARWTARPCCISARDVCSRRTTCSNNGAKRSRANPCRLFARRCYCISTTITWDATPSCITQCR